MNTSSVPILTVPYEGEPFNVVVQKEVPAFQWSTASIRNPFPLEKGMVCRCLSVRWEPITGEAVATFALDTEDRQRVQLITATYYGPTPFGRACRKEGLTP